MAWIYYLDRFFKIDLEEPVITDVNSGLDQLARYRKTVECFLKKIDGNILYLSSRSFFKDPDGRLLFEYDAHLVNGILSAKLIFARDPVAVLSEYYIWEKGGVYG